MVIGAEMVAIAHLKHHLPSLSSIVARVEPQPTGRAGSDKLTRKYRGFKWAGQKVTKQRSD